MPASRLIRFLVAFAFPSTLGAQAVTISGRLLDAGSGVVVEGALLEIMALRLQSVTDTAGNFSFDGVPAGVHALRVRHLAYGDLSDTLRVEEGRDLVLLLRVSPRALEMEPIEVEATQRPRAAASRAYVVTRDQIEPLIGIARHVGDVARTYIPGANFTEARNGVVCLEFRGARGGRTSGCNYPLVIVDGVPIPAPGEFLRDTPVQDLERIEFVPASQGAARFGMGSGYGALVIETRRSGVQGVRPVPTPVETPSFPNYQWSGEAEPHPSRRAFAAAALGGTAGLAAGLAAIGCFPGAAEAGGRCISDIDASTALPALLLPLAGAVAGTQLFGATEGSRGRLLTSLLTTSLPIGLGYAMYVDGERSEFSASRTIGATLIVIGAPFVATVTDRLFRRARD